MYSSNRPETKIHKFVRTVVRRMDGQTDEHTDVERKTIIPRRYRVPCIKIHIICYSFLSFLLFVKYFLCDLNFFLVECFLTEERAPKTIEVQPVRFFDKIKWRICFSLEKKQQQVNRNSIDIFLLSGQSYQLCGDRKMSQRTLF